MPSGKPRRHKTNQGGRPSNKERYDQQQAQIGRLRQLVSHRNHTTETWQLVDRLLTIINELEDQSTPQRSTTWDNTGHSTETPILPGVTITDRGIVHAGTYADIVAKWLHRHVQWSITSAERLLKKDREIDPEPKPPRPRGSYELMERASPQASTDSPPPSHYQRSATGGSTKG